jgi:rSAM/selenodomain-associated transferase 1
VPVNDLADQTGRLERCAIAIMAKAPTAGRVKTRLSPFLTPEQARDLGCCLLRDMTANLSAAARLAPIDPYIAFAPAGTEADLAAFVEPGMRFVLADGSLPAPPQIVGLGRCLYQAAHALFAAGYGAVGLLNADSPTLPTSVLVEAAGLIAMRRNCVVLGPSVDGGYYLILTKRLHAELFASIEWSTDRVAAQTRGRAKLLGLDVVDLESWDDVDDPPSLRRLVDEIGGAGRWSGRHSPYPAPATVRWIREHGVLDRLDCAAPTGAPAGYAPQDR